MIHRTGRRDEKLTTVKEVVAIVGVPVFRLPANIYKSLSINLLFDIFLDFLSASFNLKPLHTCPNHLRLASVALSPEHLARSTSNLAFNVFPDVFLLPQYLST